MLKGISKKILLYILISGLILSITAYSSNTFKDVKEYSQAIEYLVNKNIIQGTGNSLYQPNSYITIQQWVTMLGRANNIQVINWKDYVQRAYKLRWINSVDVQFPKTKIIYSKLLEIALNAFNIPIYNACLYNLNLSHEDNLIYISKELNIELANKEKSNLVTRGEAAQLLYNLLTTTKTIDPPKSPIIIETEKENINLNGFLLELQKIPPILLKLFNNQGWKCIVGNTEIHKAGFETAVGMTDFTKKIIVVTEPDTILHEFGHFYYNYLNYPPQFINIYNQEAQQSILRAYAKTRPAEYFADCFAYWIQYHNNPINMTNFKNTAPQTYEYMQNIFKDLI